MSENWRTPRGPLPSPLWVYRCPVCGFRAEWPRIKEHVEMAHPGWGGKRQPGPGKDLGRPPNPGPPKRRATVWLTEAQRARLLELGEGSLTRGVTRALDDAG